MTLHTDESRSGVRARAVQTGCASLRPASARTGSDSANALKAGTENALDCTLLAAIAAGNEAAFNQIHARYYHRIARFTRRITRRSELAAEITNDTLWQVWRSAPTFNGSSRVSTWIMGIAFHIGNNALRRCSRRDAHEEPMRDPCGAAHEPWSDGDDREWVGTALLQLAEEQRTVLELYYQ